MNAARALLTLAVSINSCTWAPPAPESTARQHPEPRRFDMDRFLELAEGMNRTERRLALLALQSRGKAGNGALRDLLARRPALASDLHAGRRHDSDPESQAALVRLRKAIVRANFDQSPLAPMLDHLRECSSVNILIDSRILRNQQALSLSMATRPVIDALDSIAGAIRCGWSIESGVVVLAPPRYRGMDLALIRVPVWASSREALDRAVARVASDDPDERDAGARELKEAGTLAEDSLWDGLLADDPQQAMVCANVLEALYTLPEPTPIRTPPGSWNDVLDRRIDIDTGGRIPLAAALEVAEGDPPLNWILAAPPITTSLLAKGISIRLLLDVVTRGLEVRGAAVGGIYYLTRPDRVVERTRGGIWAPLGEADHLERDLEALARGGSADLVRFGPSALAAVEAMAAQRPDLGPAAASLRTALAPKHLFVDGPGFVEMLEDPAIRRALDHRIRLKRADEPVLAELEALARTAGLRLRIEGASEQPVSLSFTDLPLGKALEAVAFATGRELGIDGGAVVLSPAK